MPPVPARLLQRIWQTYDLGLAGGVAGVGFERPGEEHRCDVPLMLIVGQDRDGLAVVLDDHVGLGSCPVAGGAPCRRS